MAAELTRRLGQALAAGNDAAAADLMEVLTDVVGKDGAARIEGELRGREPRG